MKAIHEFETKEEYRDYLITYYAGLFMAGELAKKAHIGNIGDYLANFADTSIEAAKILFDNLEGRNIV